CVFFQAEDGIRDFHVTGVQTCALPILLSTPLKGRVLAMMALKTSLTFRLDAPMEVAKITSVPSPKRLDMINSTFLKVNLVYISEIGRASCREIADISSHGVSAQPECI